MGMDKDMDMDMDTSCDEILAIDFGTTNSEFAILEMDRPVIGKNAAGATMTPSVVSFEDHDTVVVGEAAKRRLLTHPSTTVASVKRKLGTDHRYEIHDGSYPPEYVAACILRKLVDDANNYFHRRFTDAVITVPAYFTDSQRQAVKDAGEIAGLNVRRILNEPTAAALAYGLREEEEKRIVVYDFGGGTFDVSILTLGDGFFDVDATAGDNRLGGNDIDQCIVSIILEEVRNKNGKGARKAVNRDPGAMATIVEAAERAKIALTTASSTPIRLPNLVTPPAAKTKPIEAEPISIAFELSREQFEKAIAPLVKRTLEPVERALDDAGLDFDHVDELILVGGTTQIPYIQHFIRRQFDIEPVGEEIANPLEVVARGAAVSTLGYGREKKYRATETDIDVSDVLPRSLGVFTADGYVVPVLRRNVKIPISKTKKFTNPTDFIPTVNIPVYQGESPNPDEDEYLGDFWVDIEPLPAGTCPIDVSFRVGEEFGILEVTAKDHASGNKRKVRFESQGRLEKEEKGRWMERVIGQSLFHFDIHNTDTQEVYALQLNPLSSPDSLLQRLKDHGQIGTRTRLYHEGKWLRGDESLLSFGVEDGATLEVRKLKRRGRKKKKKGKKGKKEKKGKMGTKKETKKKKKKKKKK